MVFAEGQSSQDTEQSTVSQSASGIVALRKSNKTAEIVFRSLAVKKHFRAEMNTASMKYYLTQAGHAIDDKEYLQVWNTLQAEGMGKFVKSREVFNWTKNALQVAQAALTENADYSKIKTLGEEEVPTAEPKKRGRPKGTTETKQKVQLDAKGRRLRADGKLDKRRLNPGRPAKKIKAAAKKPVTVKVIQKAAPIVQDKTQAALNMLAEKMNKPLQSLTLGEILAAMSK